MIWSRFFHINQAKVLGGGAWKGLVGTSIGASDGPDLFDSRGSL